MTRSLASLQSHIKSIKRSSANQWIMALILIVLLLQGGCDQKKESAYPQRDIHVTIFSAQGGATDSWVRQMASLMTGELGVKLVCANLPGAMGGSGAMRVWNRRHDGYSVLGASETAMFFGINDVAPTVDQWHFFMAGGASGVVAVHKESPHHTIEQFLEDARQRPGQITLGNSGKGKLWHIKAVQLEQAMPGGWFKHIPYNGSGPAIVALMSREVDAVSCSCAEISEYVKAGQLRPLVITEEAPMEMPGFGKVRSAVEVYPDLCKGVGDLHQWLGFMLPHDVPPERVAVLEAAFQKALASPRFQSFLDMQLATKIGVYGEAAREMARRMQAVASWTAHELGVARKSPEALGIPKPPQP